jgi:hypothetical protein
VASIEHIERRVHEDLRLVAVDVLKQRACHQCDWWIYRGKHANAILESWVMLAWLLDQWSPSSSIHIYLFFLAESISI